MPNGVIVTGSLDGGVVAPDFWTESYVPASVYDKDIFTVFDDVKTSIQLGTLAYTLNFKDYAPLFTPSNGDINAGFSTLTPVQYEVADKISYAQLRTAWQADSMRPGPWEDYKGTPEMRAWFEMWLAGRSAVGNEVLYFTGKNSVPGINLNFTSAYAGLLPIRRATAGVRKPKLTAAKYNKVITGITRGTPTTVVAVDSVADLEVGDWITIVGVAGAGAATVNGKSGQILEISGLNLTLDLVTDPTGVITYANAQARFINKSNVNDALITAFSLIPQAVKSSADLRVEVPYHIAEAYGYKQGLVTPAGGVDLTQPGATQFNGKPMVVMPYYEPNTICVSLKTNNILACDVRPEDGILEVVDFGITTMDHFVGYRKVMKSIVGITNPTEHTILSPLN